MQIQELMTTKILSVTPDASIKEAARTMRNLNIGTLPVMEYGQLCGIITDRDICCRVLGEDRDPMLTKVQEIMATDVAACFIDQDIADAAHLMEDNHIRRVAVLNRDKTMAGMLSVDDLARGSHDLAGEVLESAAPLH